ncbi:MAG: NAD(P)-dependent oxidoreductase [Chloroflexi bacterium]|nr:NAD(P)-dependent oxidoreductase [Chloroflexota bacterium]
MKVLIVGGAARLGPHVIRALEGEHTLRVTDIVPVETQHEFQQVDIASPAEVHGAAEGIDAIVNCSVEREGRRRAAFDVNSRGCYNMMRAAVSHGISRVINTGPHFTIQGNTYTTFDYEINPDVPPHPSTNPYALSKGVGQEICKVFTENHDVHVLTYLFYEFRDHNNPTLRGDHPFAISWRDAAEAIRLGLEVDLATLPSRCEAFNIHADLPHQRFSNEKNKRLLGFTPQDRLEAMWQRR